jgi:histidine triad (HIT) family protein
MNSPFAQVLQGHDRKWVIAENEHFVAVLEKRPLVLGHVILISKRMEDHLFNLADEELSSMMVLSKRIAHVLQKVIPCKKIGTSVIGLETRHAHLHLVPICSADDLNFTRTKLSPSDETLQETLNKITKALSAL